MTFSGAKSPVLDRVFEQSKATLHPGFRHAGADYKALSDSANGDIGLAGAYFLGLNAE